MKNTINPSVSIIVPVYNASTTLCRCIDSILAQTFTDFELLLINDGSKDNSGVICDEYVAKDARVRVIHKENGGVSSARNLGLDNAKGEWIAFVDSDDWVAVGYIKNLYSHATDNIDLVVSFPTYIYNDGSSKIPKYKEMRVCEHNFEKIFVEHSMHQNTSPWSKLFRKQLIEENNIRFCEEMHIGEDLLFLYNFMLVSIRMYISPDTDYMYSYDVATSLTKRVNSFKSEYTGYANIKQVVNRLITIRNIRSNASLQRLGWVIGFYTRNVLNALYHNNTIGRKSRIEILRDMDVQPYIRYLNITARKERFLIMLLKNRLYFFYDLLRTIVAKLKK